MPVLNPEKSIRIIAIYQMKTVVEATHETLHITKMFATVIYVEVYIVYNEFSQYIRCMLMKNETRNLQNDTDHTRNAKKKSEKETRITQEMFSSFD
jgi:hypothetical protein